MLQEILRRNKLYTSYDMEKALWKSRWKTSTLQTWICEIFGQVAQAEIFKLFKISQRKKSMNAARKEHQNRK